MDSVRNTAVMQPLGRFRDFWAELDAVLGQIRTQRLPPSVEAAARGSDASARSARDAIRASTDALFRTLRDAILAKGGPPPPRLAYGQTPIDLGYIMAAVADETLLYFEGWNGVEQWSDTLLEERIYGTRIAGERIFDEIDAQLARQNNVPEEIGVGLLLALTLGFRGKYRLLPATDAEAEIDRLRSGLYRALFFNPPPARIDWRDTLGYPPPFQAGRRERPSRLNPWIIGGMIIVLVYLAAAHVLWLANLDDMLGIADRVARLGATGAI
jgi:type VI secretion system protein ImpK